MDSWEKSSGICRRFGKGLIIAHDGRLLLRIAGRILIVAVQVLMLNHLFISKLFHTGSIWLNFRTFWCVCNMARPTCSISEGSRTYAWPTMPGSSLCEISNSALMPLHAVRVFCTVTNQVLKHTHDGENRKTEISFILYSQCYFSGPYLLLSTYDSTRSPNHRYHWHSWIYERRTLKRWFAITILHPWVA